MADVVTMAGSALHRGLELCRVLDREHEDADVHRALRSVRHELETAQDLLSRLGADIPAQRDGQAGREAPETSQAAARAIRTRSGSQRHLLLEHLAKHAPLADFQMQRALGMDGNTQRPRRYELAQAGYIRPALDEDGNRLRVTNRKTGLACDMWTLTPSGRAALSLLAAGQMALFVPGESTVRGEVNSMGKHEKTEPKGERVSPDSQAARVAEQIANSQRGNDSGVTGPPTEGR